MIQKAAADGFRPLNQRMDRPGDRPRNEPTGGGCQEGDQKTQAEDFSFQLLYGGKGLLLVDLCDQPHFILGHPAVSPDNRHPPVILIETHPLPVGQSRLDPFGLHRFLQGVSLAKPGFGDKKVEFIHQIGIQAPA